MNQKLIRAVFISAIGGVVSFFIIEALRNAKEKQTRVLSSTERQLQELGQ